MFDHIANPPKGKGKEKDVGKRRAYVRVVTTLGGGSLNLELFCEKVRVYVLHQRQRFTYMPINRPQKRVTTFSCSQDWGNTMIASSTVSFRDLWYSLSRNMLVRFC